jgi:4-hydroxybenzoate polyprenyltransferase
MTGCAAASTIEGSKRQEQVMTFWLAKRWITEREALNRGNSAGGHPFGPAHALPAGVLSLNFWRSYVITMRPYLLFVSGITGIVGMSQAPDMPLLDTALLASAFFLSYGLGQALTDCFQTDTDSLSSPYRPMVQGKVRRRDVLAVSLIGLAAGGTGLVLYNSVNLPLVLLGIAGLATYTPFKRRWWSGPFYNAWIVAVLCLIGYTSAIGAAGVPFAWSPALVATLFAVLFGYANFVLAGYFKDISADRATGYRTLPVVFGLRASSIVSDLFALLTLVACGAALYYTFDGAGPGVEHVPALLFAGVGATSAVLAQMRLHRVRSEAEAHGAIGLVVHAYILLLSAIVAAQEPWWSVATAIIYAGFVVVMALRPMREQI